MVFLGDPGVIQGFSRVTEVGVRFRTRKKRRRPPEPWNPVTVGECVRT